MVGVHRGCGQGPAVAEPGTSWDGVSLMKGHGRQHPGAGTVLLVGRSLTQCDLCCLGLLVKSLLGLGRGPSHRRDKN